MGDWGIKEWAIVISLGTVALSALITVVTWVIMVQNHIAHSDEFDKRQVYFNEVITNVAKEQEIQHRLAEERRHANSNVD